MYLSFISPDDNLEFSAGTKKFVLPDAVAKGFLKIEDADTMGSFEKIGLLTERKIYERN